MTEAQFELMLAAFREQHNEVRAIHEAALGKLRGLMPRCSAVLSRQTRTMYRRHDPHRGYLDIYLIILAGLAWLTLQDVPFWSFN